MRCGACVGRRALRRRRQQVRRRLACRAGASAHASRRCRAIGLPPSVPADRQLGHRRLPAPMLPHLHRESAGSAALHSVPSWHCPRRAAGAPTRAGRRRARGGRRRALREGWRGYPIYRMGVKASLPVWCGVHSGSHSAQLVHTCPAMGGRRTAERRRATAGAVDCVAPRCCAAAQSRPPVCRRARLVCPKWRFRVVFDRRASQERSRWRRL